MMKYPIARILPVHCEVSARAAVGLIAAATRADASNVFASLDITTMESKGNQMVGPAQAMAAGSAQSPSNADRSCQQIS